MNPRLDLLRARVFAAHGLRGHDGFSEACEAILDDWFLFPIVEHTAAIARARKAADERLEVIALLRDSYGGYVS